MLRYAVGHLNLEFLRAVSNIVYLQLRFLRFYLARLLCEDMGTHELLIIGPLTFLVGSRIHWKVFNFGE